MTVRTRVINNGEPLQLDYRLENTQAGWKITDVNVMGIWLVDNYRSVFAQEIGQKGIDGLIATLKEKTRTSPRPRADLDFTMPGLRPAR